MPKPSKLDVRLVGRKVAERFAAIAPDTFESIVNEQGWDDETLILLVCGFVDRHDLSGALVAHLRTCADQENAETAALVDVCACGQRYTDGDADEDSCINCRPVSRIPQA